MQHRTAGSARLATAVAAVLAVTALGAGTLATAPAAFAATPVPTVTAGATEATDLPTVPEESYFKGAGPSGFLTQPKGSSQLLWTEYASGRQTVLEEPRYGGSAFSDNDVVVLGEGRYEDTWHTVTLRDMATPSAPGVEIKLLPLDASFIGAVSSTSVLANIGPAGGPMELHIVTKDGETTTTRKVAGLPDDVSYFWFSAVRGGFAKVLYGSTLALIDLREAKVVKTSPYGSPLLFPDAPQVWTESDATGVRVVSVDRETGERKETALGVTGPLRTAVVGDWFIYGKEGETATALSLVDGRKAVVAANATQLSTASDGSVLLADSRAGEGGAYFRVTAAGDGAPVLTRVADIVVGDGPTIEAVHVPARVNLDSTGGKASLGWTLSRPEARLQVVIQNASTGRRYTRFVDSPTGDERFSFDWDGVIDGVDAPNGTYNVTATAMPVDSDEPADSGSWFMTVTRTANPHDFTNNGSTDLLARDASGVLWRDDLRDRPVGGQTRTAQRSKVGSGWNTYKHIEAAGNIGGAAQGDLVAVDGAGVLWTYLGKGDGTFTARKQVGGGWQGYDKITAGSDLNADGRADLLATDRSGVLWFYAGTGNAAGPYKKRVSLGGGWQAYNQITAVGNIAGGDAGDLVARDKNGVLWLYLGKGDGTFTARRQIGGGWQGYSQLVGAGDVDSDGRPDLIAYGAGGTYVYRSTGSTTSPFAPRASTNLYAGEGTKFTSVS
ncbi:MULTISPECIES: FG-GAP-like repeat-containing protein [unclassified Streptomyces]|uniref:FG-GAP-like repeat-containing protein n=1 Tax=unclassified Streptomyces TaxID=2593676 RepID=UPI0036FFCDF1